MHYLVNIKNLVPKTNKTGLSVTTDYVTDDVSESDEVKTNTWADVSSIKLAITELSGFPSLTLLYNISVSLAVTTH